MWMLVIAGLIGLAIYFGIAAREIWLSGKKLAAQAGEMAKVAAEISIPVRERDPVGGLYEDPERVRQARSERRRIRQMRAKARRRRLEGALGRWNELDHNSFASIGPDERERARARVKEGRS